MASDLAGTTDLFEPFPAMETERLRLRAAVREDAAEMFRLFSDDRVNRYLGKAPPASIDELHAKVAVIIASRRDGTGIWWALDDRSTGLNLGGAGIWRWEKEHFRGEIGYQLTPSRWGEGLVPEALRPIIRFGFERMGLHSLEAKVHPGNQASVRVLEKLGFVKEGHLVENFYNPHRAVFEDTAIYSLLRVPRTVT